MVLRPSPRSADSFVPYGNGVYPFVRVPNKTTPVRNPLVKLTATLWQQKDGGRITPTPLHWVVVLLGNECCGVLARSFCTLAMQSTISVTEKTVNNRDVVVLTKEYNNEVHEVFIPRDQLTQVVIQLLATMNDQKNNQKDELVLIRKSELGYIHE